jgi:hypothetical protein
MTNGRCATEGWHATDKLKGNARPGGINAGPSFMVWNALECQKRHIQYTKTKRHPRLPLRRWDFSTDFACELSKAPLR